MQILVERSGMLKKFNFPEPNIDSDSLEMFQRKNLLGNSKYMKCRVESFGREKKEGVSFIKTEWN